MPHARSVNGRIGNAVRGRARFCTVVEGQRIHAGAAGQRQRAGQGIKVIGRTQREGVIAGPGVNRANAGEGQSVDGSGAIAGNGDRIGSTIKAIDSAVAGICNRRNATWRRTRKAVGDIGTRQGRVAVECDAARNQVVLDITADRADILRHGSRLEVSQRRDRRRTRPESVGVIRAGPAAQQGRYRTAIEVQRIVIATEIDGIDRTGVDRHRIAAGTTQDTRRDIVPDRENIIATEAGERIDLRVVRGHTVVDRARIRPGCRKRLNARTTAKLVRSRTPVDTRRACQ